MTFYDEDNAEEIDQNMVKRPEMMTSSSRRGPYMNSVRYKKNKAKERCIDEIKEESKENMDNQEDSKNAR